MSIARRWIPRATPGKGTWMEYRQFGQTDLRVSAIGFGCWEISGTYGQIDEAHFIRAVHRALDGGINCFDTAEAYGMGISERALAKALGARRKDVVGRHQGRRRLSGRAQPPRQHAPAHDGRPRQQPAQSRHRSCRCLSGALAGHQHAVRGDHAHPRRRRPSGQGALRRRVELPPVAAGSLHEAAAHRRRAVRLEHVRPPDAARRSSRGAKPTTSA